MCVWKEGMGVDAEGIEYIRVEIYISRYPDLSSSHRKIVCFADNFAYFQLRSLDFCSADFFICLFVFLHLTLQSVECQYHNLFRYSLHQLSPYLFPASFQWITLSLVLLMYRPILHIGRKFGLITEACFSGLHFNNLVGWCHFAALSEQATEGFNVLA